MHVTLFCGDATEWSGHADLVLTNPYAPLPACLIGAPALISNFAERKAQCEAWVRSELVEISVWGRGHRNRVWAANVEPVPVDLSDLVEEEFAPGRGWFPLDLPRRLLAAYAQPCMTVWDGFMGRGTVGKACVEMGLHFVGVDRDYGRFEMAREYLGC